MKKKAEEFLKSKGMIKEGFTQFVIKGDFGTLYLGELLTEFAESQAPNNGMISEIADEDYSKLFDEWVNGWDTSENVKEHLRGQKSFYERFNKWMRSKLSPQETSDNWVKERSDKIELLEKYSMWLSKNSYMDIDWQQEEPYAIDEFMEQLK